MIKKITFIVLLLGFIGCFGAQEAVTVKPAPKHMNVEGLDVLAGTALYALYGIQSMAQRPDSIPEKAKKEQDEDFDAEVQPKQPVKSSLHDLAKLKNKKQKWIQGRDSARRCLDLMVSQRTGKKVLEISQEDLFFLTSWGLYEWISNANIRAAQGTHEALDRFIAENNPVVPVDDSKKSAAN